MYTFLFYKKMVYRNGELGTRMEKNLRNLSAMCRNVRYLLRNLLSKIEENCGDVVDPLFLGYIYDNSIHSAKEFVFFIKLCCMLRKKYMAVVTTSIQEIRNKLRNVTYTLF